jgi:hypothetical protein
VEERYGGGVATMAGWRGGGEAAGWRIEVPQDTVSLFAICLLHLFSSARQPAPRSDLSCIATTSSMTCHVHVTKYRVHTATVSVEIIFYKFSDRCDAF